MEEDDKNVQEKNINPLEFNASKRKLLGDGVQESFLNPKPFKVEKMTLPSATKTIVLKKGETQVISQENITSFLILGLLHPPPSSPASTLFDC